MPTVREYEAALQRNPADTEAFVALRKAYRQAQKHDKLVTLYETRAQAIEDGGKAAELFYLAAELRLDQLQDPVGAEADLANAVDRDPNHIRAAARLKDMYREQGRMPEYMTMLEMEAAAVARTRDASRIAELQSEMSQLFINHFARLERSIRNAQRPGRLTPENVKSIESARKIYRALGDYRSVVRLYELELEGTADAKRRGDLLLGLGRVLAEKLEELDAAAQRVGEVIRLRPRDEKALELLAAIYANPNWIGADGLERAAAIYHQLARRRQEAGDVENAVAALRRALQAIPGHPESADLLERVYFEAKRFPDLDRYYRERVSAARSPAERVDFLYKRAQLAESHLNDVAEAQRVYTEIAALEPPAGPATEHLAELYTAGHEYAKLAELREKQLGAIAEPEVRVRIMTELSALYRDRLGDRDQAAIYLHAILQIDPENQGAMAAYADHFREKGDWPALADLLEFSLDRARAHGAQTDELVRRLEEIATIAEKNLADGDRALEAWRRIEEIAPAYTRAREAQRRILLKSKNWERMAALLEREAATQDQGQRIETLKRIAQLQREKLGNAARAIEIYREILRVEPHDPIAARALVDIYEHAGDYAGLAQTLREQVETATSKQERVSLLRRLLVIYDERLADVREGAWAAGEILAAVPGDRDTLTRLEALLERAGDALGLVKVLEQHVKVAANTDERLQIVRRIAEILQTRLDDLPAASERWEEAVRLDPDDARALDALMGIYTTLQKAWDLARVLDMQVERVTGDPAQQAEYLRRCAQICESTLDDKKRARRCWEQLCELLPADAEALEALSRIYTAGGDWTTLVRILERQVPLAADPKRAVELALLRARILDEHLHAPEEAARALEQLVSELDPRSWEAHERLRDLYQRVGDWTRVIRVAERQLFLVEAPAERAPRALELGALWRDRLGDNAKAIAAFERALEIAPDNVEALTALAPLYRATKNAQRLIFTNERLLEHAPDPAHRIRLMLDIATLCEEELRDGRLSFEWFKRAYGEDPSAESLKLVERVAERHGLWEDLIQIYEGIRARATEPFAQLEAATDIAAVCEERLNDPTRAFNVLRDALPADPAGRDLLTRLEELAERSGNWTGLLEVYARVARARTEMPERVELLKLRAAVKEQHLADPSGALDEYLRSFAISPTNPATQEEILRLARITSRWEDALKVQGQLFAMAEDLQGKLAVARNAAYLVEHEVKDPIRAFRAYVNAFRLAPEDPEITGHLWRLAAIIGRYPAEAATPPRPGPGESIIADISMVELPSTASSGGEELELDDADVEADLEELEEVDELDELDELELLDEEAEEPLTATPPPPRPSVGAGAPPPSPAAGARPQAFETPWEELAHVYETLPADDPQKLHGYLLRIAEIWERGQRDIGRALLALERAFKLDVHDQTVRAELERMGEEHDRWDDVAAIYLGGVDDFGPLETAVGLHHDVARIHEARGQTEKAEATYRAILAIKPDDAPALDGLEAILKAGERWADLANLLDKRTSGSLESLPPGAARRAKFRLLADLYETRLDKPYEAIDTLERLVTESSDEERAAAPAVTTEIAEGYEALVRLYSRVGLWAKVVESLQKLAELTPDAAAARGLRLRIAEVYETDLGQPDSAVEAYEAVLAHAPDDPDALAALDRLHEAHGRVDALQEILARRAALAQGPERIDIARRRARLLEERVGNPEQAAACLRELGLDAVHDDDLAAALLRNLRRAGLAHEAARVLVQKIELEKAEEATPERLAKIARLNLELSLLKLDDLNDPEAARREVEAALEAAPEHPDALAALARLHLKANDFAGYAETRVREARALAGKPEAVTALLDAGRVYRDQLSDEPRARTCFEQALEADPQNLEAMRALAAMLSAAGLWAEAKTILERQALVPQPDESRAAALTDLARACWEGLGDATEAQNRLDEALLIVPDYVPAVIAVADIYYKESQWELAERRLSEAVRKLRGQPQQMARLYQRLAEVHEKLGKLEEAYRQLVEADRTAPGQLLIKLSLGENRFRAGKWREAALHLGTLGDHPDAALYPDETADALGHGAQSEMKLRRPERAIALYETALRLRPDHAPSLQALADLALDRGERNQAITYLRRIADTTPDRALRSRALEQLGEQHQAAGDSAQALATFEEALRAHEHPGEEQAPLVEKILDLQRAAGDAEGAARTSGLLLNLAKDPRERSRRRQEVASLLADRGELAQAAALLKQGMAEDPTDEGILAKLCELWRQLGQTEVMERALSATLPALAAPTSAAGRKQRALLWAQLAALLQPRDEGAATAAFERVVDLDPSHIPARAALADLYGARVEMQDAAAVNHRMLLADDITRDRSLRALGRMYAQRTQIDAARCCFEVLALLGQADPEEQAFIEANPVPQLRPDDPYAAVLEEEDRRASLAAPEAIVMAEVFSCLWDGAPFLIGQKLEEFGVSPQDRVSPVSDLELGRIYGQVAKALGNKKTALYLSPSEQASPLEIVVQAPPALVVGQPLVQSSAGEIRFQLARAIELTRPEYILAAGVRPKQFTQLFASVLKAFHPRHSRRRASTTDLATEQAAKLKKSVPYRLAKRLVELFEEMGSTSWSSARWRAVVHHTGNRAGLLLCGDLKVAARVLIQEGVALPAQPSWEDIRNLAKTHEAFRELLHFAISEEYFALRAKLGVAVARGASIAAPPAPDRASVA